MYVIAQNGVARFGGGEKAVARLLAGLAARGHRVLLLCKNREVAGQAGEYGVPTDVLRLGGDLMLGDAWRFARLLRRHRPDAVLLTTFWKLWLGAAGARWARSPRVVLRIGRSRDVPRRLKHRLVLRRWVDTTVVPAPPLRREFLAAARGLSPERVVVIPNGVPADPPAGDAAALRRELGLPADATVVGTLARLAPVKRLDRLLAAVARMPADVHCVIAGDGEERGELEAAAGRLGIRERVRLPGHRDDVASVLALLDAAVICSDREGMSNTMLEAMAAGVPVVSTAVSGAAHALTAGDEPPAGLVVEAGAEPLADALRRLVEDAGLRRALGEAGRARVRARFSLDRTLDRWEAVLGGALPGGPPRRNAYHDDVVRPQIRTGER